MTITTSFNDGFAESFNTIRAKYPHLRNNSEIAQAALAFMVDKVQNAEKEEKNLNFVIEEYRKMSEFNTKLIEINSNLFQAFQASLELEKLSTRTFQDAPQTRELLVRYSEAVNKVEANMREYDAIRKVSANPTASFTIAANLKRPIPEFDREPFAVEIHRGEIFARAGKSWV